MIGVLQQRFSIVAAGLLVLLLAAAIIQTVISERAIKAELGRQAGAQAELLAESVAGALAFDDVEAARDYVDAVRVNPHVIAAAVYDDQRRLVAGFARDGEVLPSVASARGRATVFQNGRLHVVRPVVQSGQYLGTARLRLRDASPAQRFARASSFLLFAGLSALAVFGLAMSQYTLRQANAELRGQAEALGRANDRLTREMIERERAEQALVQAKKMEALGQLTGGVAHDFNNLLMAASSGIELMERTEDPAKRKRLAEGVRQAIDRGASLTRQLLSFARRSPARAEPFDLAERLLALRGLIERSLREDIQVRLELAPDLWPVQVDPDEFDVAVLNLAVNARDAMPDGGVLTLSAHNLPAGDGDDRDRVCLKIRDTGCGISEEVAARIFEPFFTTKGTGKGTGLGLSQVYGFAASSGGGVTVDGRPGEGAEFTLYLPRSETRPERTSDLVEAGPSQTRPLRILLVEDDEQVAAGVGMMLGDLGHDFKRVTSADEAVQVLEKDRRFDLVFTDVVMPGAHNGVGLHALIRRRWPQLPVLLTTGYSGAVELPSADVAQVLHKPYRRAELAAAIADAVSGDRT